MPSSTKTPSWTVKQYKIVTTVLPERDAGVTISHFDSNFDGYSETLTRVKVITDNYPSFRGPFGFTVNPVSIVKVFERPTAITFDRISNKSISSTPSYYAEQSYGASGTVYLSPPVVALEQYGPKASEIEAIKTIVGTDLLANAFSADAMSIVTMMELDKTRDLITGAASRWSKMFEKALNQDLAKADKFLTKIGGLDSNAFKRIDRRFQRYRRLLTDKEAWSKFPPHARKSIKNWLRSSEGKAACLANGYLEFRYGWKPTVYDIQDHFAALGNISQPSREDNIRRFKQSKQGFIRKTLTKAFVPVRYNAPIVAKFELSGKWKVSAGAIVRHDVPKELQKLHAFGMFNALTSIAELVPLSFVNDWFNNFTTYLKALENTRMNTFFDKWTSVSYEATLKCTNAAQDYIMDAQTSDYKIYNRDLGLKTGVVWIPNPMNDLRWYDITALAFNKLTHGVFKSKHLRI